MGCGAPLSLADEPQPARLDVTLDLDRRGGRRAAEGGPALAGGSPPPLPPAPRHPELAALESSHWDLGRALGAPAAGPALGAPFRGAADAGRLEPEAPATPDAAEVSAAAPDDGLPEPEVDALEIHLRRPETWRRALAGALDALPFAAGAIALARLFLREATAALPAPPTGLDGLLDLVVRERTIVLPVLLAAAVALFVYATLAHALAGATLGKRLLGLRLVGPDGARPSLGRSAARSGLAVLSAALLGAGFWLALFTRSGRALHDLGASTWVVAAP